MTRILLAWWELRRAERRWRRHSTHLDWCLRTYARNRFRREVAAYLGDL